MECASHTYNAMHVSHAQWSARTFHTEWCKLSAVGGVSNQQRVAYVGNFLWPCKDTMPRRERDDDESTVMTFNLEEEPNTASERAGGRTDAQNSQIAKARAVAIKNRARRALVKGEERVRQLRAKLGADLSNEGLERVVTNLIEVEDRHRSKLADLTDKMTEHLRRLHEEVHTVHKAVKSIEKATSKRVGTLSDVSSVSASVRGS